MPKVSWGTDRSKIPGTRNLELREDELLAEALLNGGMAADFDPSDLNPNQSPLIVNARIRRDKTSRRNGQTQFAPNKPDSSPVYDVIQFNVSGVTRYFIRVARDSVNFTSERGTGGAWTPLTPPLTARITDHAVVLGKLILANGVQRLQLADLDAETLSDLGPVAPTAKYVTGFSERAVGANGGMSDEASETFYWSGNRNLSVWDALEDISSGQKRLDTAPRTEVDPISGIFGFNSVMVIPREKSIWLATPQPVASDPFKTFRSVPGVGTNLPGSIAVGRELLVFLDSRMRDISIYRPGQNIESIGIAIRDSILKDFQDADSVFSTYFTSEQEYLIGFETSTTIRVWVFNFLTKSWSFYEIPNCTSLNITDDRTPYTSFDDLLGTFDGLPGTFDELSGTPTDVPSLIYGFAGGEITKEDPEAESDSLEGLPESFYTFELQSKEYKKAKDDITVTRIEIEYQATVSAPITLQYTKNGGIDWITAKTIPTKTGKVQILKFRKQIRTRRLMWRLLATSGKFDLLGYELDIASGGESRN
jgi:hypothetical protein